MASFRVLQDCFYQSDPATNRTDFDFLESGFGILPAAAQPQEGLPSGLSGWQHLAKRIDKLNAASPSTTTYKVIFLARHGQGIHNVAWEKYGERRWDDHFSKLDGADGMHWVDARLTPLGEGQAQAAARCWAQQVKSQGMPVSEVFYSSPLMRCLQTARIMHAGPEWGMLGAPRYVPIVKESLRETNGVHTCDKRSPRSAIVARFPEAKFEDGFVDDDLLWDPDVRESEEHQIDRLRACMQQILGGETHVWISITAHSGASRAIMKALNYPRIWRLQPGEVVPIAVEVMVPEVVQHEQEMIS